MTDTRFPDVTWGGQVYPRSSQVYPLPGWPGVATWVPYLGARGPDDPVQEAEALDEVAAEAPEPGFRVPPSSGRLDPALEIGLPPADPESDRPRRWRPGYHGQVRGQPAATFQADLPGGRARDLAGEAAGGKVRGLGFPWVPPDDQLDGLETLAGDVVVAVPDAQEARSKAGQELLGAPPARSQGLQGAHNLLEV